MNQTIKELWERKSVRVFTEQEVSEEAQILILESCFQAPTAGNQQLYTILNITDPILKEKLAVTCDNQPFIAKAPFVLVFCADCKKWYDAFEASGCHPRTAGLGDLMLAVSDTNIAAQNAVTAAWSLGIGSCYIGDIMEEKEAVTALLNLPDFVFPTAMLVFGYPTEQQLLREKPQRQPEQFIVHENTYHSLNPQELEEMLQNKAGNLGYNQWIENFCQRKYNSDFSVEMSRSVEGYLNSGWKSYWKE